MLWSLFGFGMEMIVAHFQIGGIVLVFRAVLYMFVRYLMASGPRCLSYLMSVPSGPMELLFVLFEDDFINFRKKKHLKVGVGTFSNFAYTKTLKRPSTLKTPSTSRKLPKVSMLKIDKIEEFAKRDKIRTFDNLNAKHALSG